METSPETYKDLLVFLATAAVIVPLFRKFHITPILGYILAGISLGPFGFGALAGSYPWIANVTITDIGQISSLAEFGTRSRGDC